MIVLRENIQSLGNSFVQFQLWNQFRTSHIQHKTDYKANRKIHTFRGKHEMTDRTLKRIGGKEQLSCYTVMARQWQWNLNCERKKHWGNSSI
jgi:hypothetical protein